MKSVMQPDLDRVTSLACWTESNSLSAAFSVAAEILMGRKWRGVGHNKASSRCLVFKSVSSV
jgi:hypothetical protein